MNDSIANAVALTFTATVALGLLTWAVVWSLRERRRTFRNEILNEARRSVMNDWYIRDLGDGLSKLRYDVAQLQDTKTKSPKVK